MTPQQNIEMNTEFDDIRSYRDDEVYSTLKSLQQDKEFCRVMCQLAMSYVPTGFKTIVGWLFPIGWRWRWRQLTSTIHSIDEFQSAIKKQLVKTLGKSSSGYSQSGLESLDEQQRYLFICNHRDIAMDPAMVNLMLYDKAMPTLHIAIGDNLLSKPFAEKIMRLNKSFIVRRNVQGSRKLLMELKRLSAYISHLLHSEKSNVWLAQREGRAKDGIDKTEEAIIKMLLLNSDKSISLGENLRQLSIVPVAISYEWDPCDIEKANALVIEREQGYYEKQIHEDIKTIGMGITGTKGHIHVGFGAPLQGDFSNTADVAEAIDQEIMSQYQLYPSNYAACELLQINVDALPWARPTQQDIERAKQQLKIKTVGLSPSVQRQLLESYANPVTNKLNLHR